MIAFLLAFILFAFPAFAITPQYIDIIMHNAAGATETGRMLNVHQSNVVRVDVQITGTATVDFQISGPGNFGPYSKLCQPSDSSTKVTSTTTSGVFFCSVAAGNVFIAPISAWTSGTVTVVGRASTAF